MACPHYRVSTANRARGQSAAGAVQYQERGGHYASRSDDVLGTCHVGPDLGDWQVVDNAEWRPNSTCARTVILAVPAALPVDVKLGLLREHMQDWRDLLGVAGVAALHRPSGRGDARAEHGHLTLTTRVVDEAGVIGEKTRVLDRSSTSGAVLAQLRGRWQDRVNRELHAHGIDDRLDLTTRASRGLSPACERIAPREFERARRGEIHSHAYARRTATLNLRSAEAALTDAAARVSTTRAAVRLEARTQRVGRRHRARRVVDFARSQARASSLGFPRDRGDRDQDRNRQRSTDGRAAREDVAGAGAGGQRTRGAVPAVDVRGTPPSHRRGDDFLAPGAVVEARAQPAPEQPVAPPPAAPPRSLAERALRWISGADRREREAAEQARVQAAQEAAQEGARATAQAQAERERQAQAERAQAQAQAAREAQVESVRVAAVTRDPLLHVATLTGGSFYVRTADFQKAQRDRAINVPLCDWRGEPVQVQAGAGARTALRLSTIEASTLSPRQIVPVQMFPPEAQDESLSASL